VTNLLEQTDPAAVAGVLDSADAVVYAAGAGYGSPLARKVLIDRDAAITVAAAAQALAIRRYVMISSMGADPSLAGTDPFGAYLRLKGQADGQHQRPRPRLDHRAPVRPH
jgi:uncharacterized protein YbjT (DUF2867 family)